MPLKAGTIADYTNSMAEAMEKALAAEWLANKGTPLPSTGREERQLLFVAIAQGVVKHLKDNAETSLLVRNVEVIQQDNNLIESEGRVTNSNARVRVQQESGAANKVKSTGEGTQVEIQTTGSLHS